MKAARNSFEPTLSDYTIRMLKGSPNGPSGSGAEGGIGVTRAEAPGINVAVG